MSQNVTITIIFEKSEKQWGKKPPKLMCLRISSIVEKKEKEIIKYLNFQL